MKDTFASDDPCSNNARNIGVAVGAVAGAILGNVIAPKNRTVGTLIGAGLGAGVGALIGSDIDRRRCELAKVAKAHNLEMTVVTLQDTSAQGGTQGGKEAGLSVSVVDQEATGRGQFTSGSATLQPEARAYFAEIASQYSYATQSTKLTAKSSAEDRAAVEALKTKRILLVGHTDDTGSSSGNADLSEKRARAVADVFKAAGIPDAQLFYQGAGETLPVADNHDESGRARNRRVEIVDLIDQATFERYLAARQPNIAFYREKQETGASPVERSRASTLTASALASRGTASAAPRKKASTKATTGGAAVGSDTSANANAVNTVKSASAPASAPSSGSTTAPTPDVAAKPASPPAPLASASPGQAARASRTPWNFGGNPTNDTHAGFELGKLDSPSGFFIKSATAAVPIARCDRDRPRAANAVKSLRTDRPIDTAEYMPGLYNTSWTDNVNGNLVALTGVAVLRDGGAPARKPTVLVYRNAEAASRAQPDLRVVSDVNTYRGDKAILYRVFVNTEDVKCLDIVIANRTPDRATGSWLRYDRDGVGYSAAFNPTMVRTK
ncbi:OmpA family protein [Pandoraea sp. NPDC087047]|uniref:OmpA family protein n=1 Tax=Pandoraea sp. NPDC087047 TaxID=3364390 RepID=UPI00381F8288